jgi:hypothetical protein
VAEITLVKGETSALDRTWMSMPDGSIRQVAVHIVRDLPHLVGESLFGISDYRQRVASLLGCLDDGTIALAISGTRDLAAAWARLPVGGIMRLEWPLPRAALGS